MIVRDIKTKIVPVLDEKQQPVTKDGQAVTQVVPELDADGREIELWSITVPQEIEAKGGKAVDAFVAAERAKSAAPITETPAKRGGKEIAR